MKLTELRKVIREEVREAIQEELKDILLEAVRSPKPTITENLSVAQPTTTPDPLAQKAFREQMLSQMVANGGNMNLTTADNNTFRPSGPATGEGTSLGDGNVGIDQIMGLMKGK
jgi:hypothetical protein